MGKNAVPAVLAACVALVVVGAVGFWQGSDEDVPLRTSARPAPVSDDSAATGFGGRSSDAKRGAAAPAAERRQAAAAADGAKASSAAAISRFDRGALRLPPGQAAPSSGGGTGPGESSSGASVTLREALAGAAERDSSKSGAGGGGPYSSEAGVTESSGDERETLFDGTTYDAIATSGYVEHADFGTITSDAGTMSFKVRADWQEGSQDDATMVELGDGAFRIRKNVNFLRFEYVNDDGYEGGIGTPITDWQQGVDHDVVATWSGQQMWLYIDGKLVTQGPYEGTITMPEKTKLGIGSHDANLHPIAPGYVYGVQVLARPLSSVEVSERVDPNKQATAN